MVSRYEELARHYGTPLYVYDVGEIRSAYQALIDCLPEKSRLYYSLKANPHEALAAELRRLGCNAEVSSPGESEAALVAGYQPEQILYTGPGKTSYEITCALKSGISHFSIESYGDMRRLEAAASALGMIASCLIRINIDEPMKGFGLSMGGGVSQFGIDASRLIRSAGEFRDTPWVVVQGFHLYAGTQIMETDSLLTAFCTSLQVVRRLSEHMDMDPEIVDLGGGFGHPFATNGSRPDFSSLRQPLETALEEFLPGWRNMSPRVAFESGRYLVAASGTLLSTVQDVKQSKGHVFVVLDSGINHLGGMAGLRRVPRPTPSLLTASISEQETLECASVVGPLCTPLDTWARGVTIPRMKPGDIVAIPNVGAYGLTASLIAFLSRDCPIEIVTDAERVQQSSQLVIGRRPIHANGAASHI